MTGGAWAGPMHAAGAALNALGGQVDTTVATSAVNDVVVGENWSGMGRITAAASVTTLNGDQTNYGLLSMLKAQLLNTAGELHTTTVPQMVTHVQANANRGEWGIDNAINPWVLGALTGRLIELDGEYFGFMWPNNASAGLRYGAGLDALGAALSGLSALPSLAGGSVAAPAMAAADVGANAGITMASTVMSATEQAATAAISPATSGASQAGSGLLGQSPLSAPNTSTSTSGISPLAAVQSHAPAAPSLPQSQPPAMGMFAPPAAAALTPSAPSPAMPASPPVQPMTPPTPAAAPGVTSFAKPAEPFSPPPPSGGQATGLKPGMLNASALRGPVSAASTSTAVLTQPLTTTSSLATEPLAYVTPEMPRPVSTTPPPHPPLQDSGSIQTLNPPPQPQQSPPHHSPPQQPSTGSGPPPGPSTGNGGEQGSGGPGTQTPGSGLGGAPPAAPLDTRPPPIPPPPSPGEPPLRPPSPPSWAQPPLSTSAQEAQQQLSKLEQLIRDHNAKPPDPRDWGAVADYNAEASYYNSWAAQLQGQLDSSKAPSTPSTSANTAQIPSWTQPAPQQPNAPTGPNLNQQAAQIGKDVGANVPKGSRLNTLIDRLNQLHISDQQQAAEAAEVAAKAAWGETAGIVNGPNGSKLVLPANPLFGQAIMVAPDGTLSAFRGDLFPFLPK